MAYLHVPWPGAALGEGVTAAVPAQRRRQQIGVVRGRGLRTAGGLSNGGVLRGALGAEESRHCGGAPRGGGCVHATWPSRAPHTGQGATAVAHTLHAAPRRAFQLLGRGEGAAGGEGHGFLLDRHPKEVLSHHGWSLVHGGVVGLGRDVILRGSIATLPLVELQLELFNLTSTVTKVFENI